THCSVGRRVDEAEATRPPPLAPSTAHTSAVAVHHYDLLRPLRPARLICAGGGRRRHRVRGVHLRHQGSAQSGGAVVAAAAPGDADLRPDGYPIALRVLRRAPHCDTAFASRVDDGPG